MAPLIGVRLDANPWRVAPAASALDLFVPFASLDLRTRVVGDCVQM